MKNIKNITYDSLPYKRILKQTKKKIYHDFFVMHGEHLRPFKDMCKAMDADGTYMYVFMHDCTITITYVDGTIEEHFFKAGAFTDLASVPSWAKSFIDDNDPRIIVASLIHDFLFKTHLKKFRVANKYFKNIIKAEKGNWFFRCTAFFAVSTFFGRKAYNKYKATCKEFRKFYTLKTYKKGSYKHA